MKKLFKDIIDQLVIINNFFKIKALTKKDLKEEQENFDDFILIIQELHALLAKMKKTSIEDVRQGSKNLMRLHILMNNVRWYVQNVHSRIKDVFKEYPVPDDM